MARGLAALQRAGCHWDNRHIARMRGMLGGLLGLCACIVAKPEDTHAVPRGTTSILD
jgi:hypothetical protein